MPLPFYFLHLCYSAMAQKTIRKRAVRPPRPNLLNLHSLWCGPKTAAVHHQSVETPG